ncbi:MAG: glycosyltransferase family 39 protein, partial [bacterium]
MAFSFRFTLARYYPNDAPNDGKIYAQIARNVLELHVYSHATEAPFEPSLIRLPGYPLFLAAVYSVFGHDNNTAVRIIQAVIDTAACGLVALIAFLWEPEQKRKRAASVAALVLAAACPFSAIYVATILTETPTVLLALAMTLTATFAFRATSRRRSLVYWVLTGIIAGVAVLFRPDSGLFAAAVGLTLVLTTLFINPKSAQEDNRVTNITRRLGTVVSRGALYSAAFCLVLVPWTIRNERVFHLFQPLAPAHAEMPGEFVPRGYLAWLRTWLDDGRYIAPVLWTLDEQQIKIEEFPDRAFDSPDEKATVAALLENYNHPPDTEDTSQKMNDAGSGDTSAQSSATPDVGTAQDEESDNSNSDQTDQSDQSDQSDESDESD